MRLVTFCASGVIAAFLMVGSPALAAPRTGKPATCLGSSVHFDGLDVATGGEPAPMYEVPNDGIEEYMPIGSSRQGLPETIQGIWWMDGNPGGLLVTLGNATYNAATRTARLPASEPGSYAFWPTPLAGCVQGAVSKAQSGFLITFSEDFRHATLVNFRTDEQGQVQPENQSSRFTMDLAEDGHWVRHSYVFNITIPDYQLRRIVRGDGTRDTFNYQAYLNFAGPTALIGAMPSP